MDSHYLHVLGHVHEHYVEEGKGDWILIHPDTWRDEYRIDDKTKTLVPKVKQYVLASVDNGKISNWQLVKLPIKQKSYSLADVWKNEMVYLKKAATAEGRSG